jgi:hypothetical protein
MRRVARNLDCVDGLASIDVDVEMEGRRLIL